MNPRKNIIVLFHRDHDGFASAYCAWRIFGDAAEYHSIRSRKGDDTALRIAQANGGGGHPQAAGFTTEASV